MLLIKFDRASTHGGSVPAGTRISDSSGRGNHGTLRGTGATYVKDVATQIVGIRLGKCFNL